MRKRSHLFIIYSGQRRNSYCRHESGVQLIEVVLVMPLLLLLLAATAEFGRYFYTYSALSRATHIAARYASDKILDGTNPDHRAAAKNMAVYGLATTGTTPVITGLTTNQVTVTPNGTAPSYQTVTVSINYTYQPVFNLGNWLGGSWANVPVTPSTTMKYLL